MPAIDRSSIEDAQRQIEKFIPNKHEREGFLHFLADMILYANTIDRGNWNLNLDKAGRFLQFNTGQEYCLTISTQGTFLVCLKEPLRQVIAGKGFEIEFRGYLSKKRKTSQRLEDVPDCLAKVPGSVGCLIQHEHVIAYTPYFQHPVQQFIDVAMRETTILPKMKNAHSSGSIAYVSQVTQRRIPNPYYVIEEDVFQATQEQLASRARSMTESELRNTIARQQQRGGQKVNVITSSYIRNPYVAEFVKRQAAGICQDCHEPAPFISKRTGEPYLEPHHIVPLSRGGKDCVENVIALCPNCHRKRHYG